MAGGPQHTDQQGDPADDRFTSLPTWLLKELERAGVGDAAIEVLDEDAARNLVAEIRSDAID